MIALHKSGQQQNLESASRDPQRQPDDFIWHSVEDDLRAILTGKAPWMFFLQAMRQQRRHSIAQRGAADRAGRSSIRDRDAIPDRGGGRR